MGDSTFTRARSTQHWPGPNQLDIDPVPLHLTSIQAHSTQHWLGLVKLDIGLARSARARQLIISPALLGSTSTQDCSTRQRPRQARLKIGPDALGLIWARDCSVRHWLDCLGLTWIGPSQNPSQNAIWIIQKCIQCISNPYPIE